MSVIELDPLRFGPEALAGLEAFSHVEIVFHFHGLPPEREATGARRPRDNPAWPLAGIFAQRGSPRPNRLGVTRCRLLAVEGLSLTVEGLDALDGTPVLDIKPWFRQFGPRGETRQPAWVDAVMEEYWEPGL